jgi:DNA polymerase delta subunit 1
MGKVAVAQLFHLLDRMALGLHLVASEHEAVWNIEVRPWCSHEHHRIESIEKRTNDGSNYVYDFETHNHHFGVGPGLLVVHNTDSVFTLFPNFDVKTAIRAGILAASIMTDKVINRHPLKLEFEKTQVPFVVIAKKRYLARKFESLDDEKGTVYGQGLATKRRNYCPLVKTVYEDLIQTLMLDLEGGPKQCLVRLKGHLQRLVDAHLEKTTEELAAQDDDDDEDEADAIVEEVMTPAARKLVDPLSLPLTIKDFCISASLRAESSYKGVNPLPHVALARRMKERDPASAPRPGDRFAYVVIMESKRGDALSENTEDPTYAQAHNLPLDRLYYLNQQLHNPIVQFMAVLGQKDATSALFDACAKKLQPIHHQTRHNIRDIRSYFGPKK